MNRCALGVGFAALAALATPAPADTIYKSVRPDGSVVYSDKPTPGARNVERLDLQPSVSIRRDAPQRSGEASQGAQIQDRTLSRQRARESAQAEISAATTALEQAEQRLEEGKEPLAGERRFNANGIVGFDDRYQQRIATLELQVSEARRRLDAAYAARNAVRD